MTTTALSRTDLRVSSFDKFEFEQETEQRPPLYVHRAKWRIATYAGFSYPGSPLSIS